MHIVSGMDSVISDVIAIAAVPHSVLGRPESNAVPACPLDHEPDQPYGATGIELCHAHCRNS